MALGWSDIVQSYRRTFLGPVWITLNLVIFATAITLVYGALFGLPTKQYAAYVVCGMIAWFWVAALLSEVGNTFLNYTHFIKATKIDKAQFVWAAVYKQLLILLHHMVVYAALLILGIIDLSFYILLSVPAVLLLFALSIPVTAIAAILFARYRDLSRLVGSAMVVLMMVTPVFWQANMVQGWRAAFYYLNPIYYLIEIIRQPLLGHWPGVTIVAVVCGMTIVAWIAGALFYRRFERYVVFWL
jgi:lipopolysaccharide transport system permease protein